MNKLALISMSLSASILAACTIPMSSRGGGLGQPDTERVGRMCTDLNYAYEAGNNDGLQRKQLDTAWVEQCHIDYRVQIRTAYQNGYHTGMQNAPIVVQGRGFGGGRGGGYSSSQSCTFSSDCGSGDYSCRPDRDGTKVCMGYGSIGDACWFGSDCLSGSCDAGAKTCR